MSVGTVTWVFKHSNAKNNDRLVLLALADLADDDGDVVYKAQQQTLKGLAEKAKCSVTTVVRAIHELELLGELDVTRTPGSDNRYRIVMDRDEQAVIAARTKANPPRTTREAARVDARRRVGGGVSKLEPPELVSVRDIASRDDRLATRDIATGGGRDIAKGGVANSRTPPSSTWDQTSTSSSPDGEDAAAPSSSTSRVISILSARRDAISDRQTIDLCRDVYAPVWDEVAAVPAKRGDRDRQLLDLVVSFVEDKTGQRVSHDDRPKIGVLVATYGKGALWGLDEAIGATEEHSVHAWFAYARRRIQKGLLPALAGEEGAA